MKVAWLFRILYLCGWLGLISGCLISSGQYCLDGDRFVQKDGSVCVCKKGSLDCGKGEQGGMACHYEGKSYKDGEQVDSSDRCSSCRCEKGKVLCSSICGGDNPSGGSCLFGGKTREDGESWVVNCNTCSCHRGQVSCTNLSCPPPRNEDPKPPVEKDKVCYTDDPGKCGKNEYCFVNDGVCGEKSKKGVCKQIPSSCPKGPRTPVCGCNGQTYASSCFAKMDGANIRHEGTCKQEKEIVCNYHGKVFRPGDQFLAADACNGCSCNEKGQVSCTKKLCKKPCGGYLGTKCGKGEFCRKFSCGSTAGSCQKLADYKACLITPGYAVAVCGCDGKTYAKDCLAFSLGINIAHRGECKK